MRSVKSVGGLIRGRGMSETQRAQCLPSMPACPDINNAMQEFTGHILDMRRVINTKKAKMQDLLEMRKTGKL